MSIDPRIGRANRETFHVVKAFIDRQDYNRFAADPLPDVDRDLSKYQLINISSVKGSPWCGRSGIISRPVIPGKSRRARRGGGIGPSRWIPET